MCGFQGCYLVLEFISGVLLGLGIYFRGATWPWNLFQGCYLALEFISGVLFGLGIYVPLTDFHRGRIVMAIFRI